MRRIGEAKECGFTLAEVLVTLMIIGVVGAMTIPGFIANHQKKVYVESLKKFAATFQGGMQKYMAEKGCVGDLSCTGAFQYVTWHGSAKALLDNMIKPTFNVIKTCAYNDSTCVKGPYTNVKGTESYNDPGFWGDARTYRYKTTDGFLVWLLSGSANCGKTGDISSKANPTCAVMAVDINADKPPNIIGKDYFLFYLGNNGYLYPYGGIEYAKFYSGSAWQTSNNYWKYNSTYFCPNNNPYVGCAARIMEEGWEMTY